MAEIGIFLSSEEQRPPTLVQQAQQAERAGFESVLISDHFHPWIDRQGESPFVWSVIGGIASTTELKVTTGVTCPTVRIHPAVVAQAAATCTLMLNGRFALGVGSGEALNEHILGDHWPPVATRLEMLDEAIEVMRSLWSGELVSHHGTHYTVENARIYSCPDAPPPVIVSAFGPASRQLAASIGDGLITTSPDPATVEGYHEDGGRGPVLGVLKVCWDPDQQTAVKRAHELWASECLPGQLNQELALPSFFEQATELVTEDMVADKVPCGPDPQRHAEVVSSYLDAGFDEVYINQIGDDLEGFLAFFEREVRPRIGL